MAEAKIPVYPQGFFNFRDGVDISDQRINEWIAEAREYLEHAEDGEYSYAASGNTFVIVFKYADDYIYCVSKGYMEASEWREQEETRTIKINPIVACWRKWFGKKHVGKIPTRPVRSTGTGVIHDKTEKDT